MDEGDAAMPIYFLLHDAARFHQWLRPALTASWRQRSFEPCRALCTELAPAVRSFIERYHLGREEPLLCRVIDGLPFDRDYWRHLVSEVLFYGAADIPEIQTDPDTLNALLAPGHAPDVPRECLAPIQQAHFGARDLVFGGFYRPQSAGYNDTDDVARLATYLASCDPLIPPPLLPGGKEGGVRGRVTDLPGRDDAIEDRQEELEFARQCLFVLRDLYAAAAKNGQVVVCEVLGGELAPP